MLDQTISRFWDNYLRKVKWLRCQTCGVALACSARGTRHQGLPRAAFGTHAAQDMEQYLQDKGRNASLKGW